MRRPTYVLGTGLSHDGSACLLKDGRVSVAIEKERITRIKHDGMNDSLAIAYCLDAAGIRMADVALVVQNANFSGLRDAHSWFHGPRILDPSVPVVTISHHLAHAYSAAFTSSFEHAAVLVIDGCGNAYSDCTDLAGAIVPDGPPKLQSLFFEKDSLYELDGTGRLRSVFKDYSSWNVGMTGHPMSPRTTLHSIGGVYQGVSAYVFSGLDDPGKLMGLAPYGRPGTYDMPVFDLRDGRVFVRHDWMNRFDRPCHTYDQFKADFQYYADIACWIQREIERALLYVVECRAHLTTSRNLCYTGGVALNAVANRRICTEGPFTSVHIPPAAGDNGLALGCALYGWLEVIKGERAPNDGVQYFGRSYLEESRHVADAARAQWFVLDGADAIAEAATLLADGKVIAWFNGGAEFGPRALGNRSILADPRRADLRDFINREIKDREDFRPFAPAVLAEDRACFFTCAFESPHMLLVSPVRDEWRDRIPGVVHRDGSARLQTVQRESNPRFYDLIVSFKRRTGIGVVLNTSLNKRRMPIIETPQQALDFFVSTPLDALMLDGYLIAKCRAEPACREHVAE